RHRPGAPRTLPSPRRGGPLQEPPRRRNRRAGAAVCEGDPASPRPVSSWLDETRDSYDAEASGHRDEVQASRDRLPHLRAHLRLFAELIDRTADGPVADIGCGPGYATGFLGDLGLDAFVIDLSPAMLEIARRDH